MIDLSQVVFHDANEQLVQYDGSTLKWRVSAYSLILNSHQELLTVVNREEQLLDVPGGGIEFGESIATALSREAREEAGATIRILRFLSLHEDFFYHSGDHQFYQTIQLFYQAELLSKLIPPTDPRITQVVWTPLAQVNQMNFYQAIKTAAAQLSQ